MLEFVIVYFFYYLGTVSSKPIAECCSNEITEKSTTAQTTNDANEVMAAYFELQQSAIVSVEQITLVIAGILMLITTLILIIGTCYVTCFHDEKCKYIALPQIDFHDEGIRDFESLIDILSEIGHPLHKTVKNLAAEFDLLKPKTPVSNL